MRYRGVYNFENPCRISWIDSYMVKRVDREAMRIGHDFHCHPADSEYEQAARIEILWLKLCSES